MHFVAIGKGGFESSVANLSRSVAWHFFGDVVETFEMKRVSEMKFIPVIMTEFTDKERAKLIKRHKKYINSKGEWIGSFSGGRPKINMVTKKSKEDGASGKRKMQVYSTTGVMNKAPQVQVCVSQVVLIAAGFFPEEDEEASHLCHNGACIRLEHLVWERGDYNRRRKICAKLGECVCRQERKCIFGAHD